MNTTTKRAVKGTAIDYHDFSTPRDWDRTVNVTYKPRTGGHGYNVYRADNGRLLGWVIPPDSGRKCWVAYNAEEAFKGDDVNDTGYILDEVSDYLTRNGDGWNRIGGSTRREATNELLEHLSRQRATALGYGRNHEVRRHLADNEPLREWFKNGMQGECPSRSE